MNNKYNKYKQKRDELHKLLDKYDGISETIEAMVDTVVWAAEDDSIRLVEESLKAYHELTDKEKGIL